MSNYQRVYFKYLFSTKFQCRSGELFLEKSVASKNPPPLPPCVSLPPQWHPPGVASEFFFCGEIRWSPYVFHEIMVEKMVKSWLNRGKIMVKSWFKQMVKSWLNQHGSSRIHILQLQCQCFLLTFLSFLSMSSTPCGCPRCPRVKPRGSKPQVSGDRCPGSHGYRAEIGHELHEYGIYYEHMGIL